MKGVGLKPNRILRRFVVIVLFSSVMGAILALNEVAPLLARTFEPTRASSAPRFAYFFGTTGKFLKLDTKDFSVDAQWTLPRINGVARLLPPDIPRGAKKAHGYWIAESLAYDKTFHRLYGIFPTPGVTSPEWELNRMYEMLVFRLPTLEVEIKIDLAQGLKGPPSLLVSPNGGRLFLSYGVRPTKEEKAKGLMVNVLDIYDTRTLRKVHTIREKTDRRAFMKAKAVINTSFSKNAYFSSDGKTIYDGLKAISVNGNEFVKRKSINPLKALAPSQRAKLRPYERMDPADRIRRLRFGWPVSRNGRTVLRVSDQSRSTSAYWTIDLDTSEVSPVIEAPLSVGHITPDGTKLVLEELRVPRKQVPGEPTPRPTKTGRVLIYDVDSGDRVKDFRWPELSGRSLLLCIAPNSDMLFYADSSGRLYTVQVSPDIALRAVSSTFIGDRWTDCIFADR